MGFEEKVNALIKIIHKLLEKLKRKLNMVKKRTQYITIVGHIKNNQDHLLILSEGAKNIDDFKNSYTNLELKNLFSEIKNEINNSKKVL